MGLLDKVLGKRPSHEGEPLPPVDSPQDQSDSEQELVAYIKNKVEECRQSASRITHEGIWMTNIAYLLGFDSVYYDTTTRQFKIVGTGKSQLRRNRIHVNKILPTVQNRLARLCKNPPKYDVRPNSNEPDDKDAARLALQALMMIWDKERIDQKRIPLFMWTQECGHAYIKVSWDDQKGEPIVDDAGTLDYEGDIRVDIVSAFEIFPDPLAKSLEEAQWIVQAKVRKLDYFKTHYQERGNLVKEEGAWLLSAQYEQRINSLNNTGPSSSGPNQSMKGAAIELAYYERRSKKHPMGRLVVSANGVLLEDKPLPTGEIPFVKFDDMMIGGKYYSESIITHARPLQDQFNRVITRRAEWTNKLLAGKYIAARGSEISKEALNDQSGEVLYYSPTPNGLPPSPMQIPIIPQYAYTEEDKLQGHLYDIMGINEPSRGQLPSASIPALGMQLLIEQDDTRIGVITEANEHAWARVGKLILLYVQEFYQTPRLLKIAQKNMEYQVRKFVGADIRDNSDVVVIRGSTLPGSKILRRQEIMNAWQSGLLGNPQDPQVREKVHSAMEFGDLAEIWKDISIDMEQIKRDIKDVENGLIPAVSEADNHQLHWIEKNSYRKSEKFLQLDTEKQKVLLDNMEAHLKEMMMLANPAIGQIGGMLDINQPAMQPKGPQAPLQQPGPPPAPMGPSPGPAAPGGLVPPQQGVLH